MSREQEQIVYLGQLAMQGLQAIEFKYQLIETTKKLTMAQAELDDLKKKASAGDDKKEPGDV